MKRYFDTLRTLNEVKAEYKRLVKIHHPDVGGDTATMQEINAQYDEAVKRIATTGEGVDKERAAQEVPAEFRAVLSKVVALKGIDVDLVGAWLWITGDTWTHKATLKAAGFRWASKKRAWYWYPEWAAVERGSKKSLDEIKDKYGAQRLLDGSEARTAPKMLGEAEKPQKRSAQPKRRRSRRSPVSGQVAFEF